IAAGEWKSQYRPLMLTSTIVNENLVIADRRSSNASFFSFSGIQKSICLFCGLPRKDSEIYKAFPDANPAALTQVLDELVAYKLLLLWQDASCSRYVSLPVATDVNHLNRAVMAYRASSLKQSVRNQQGATGAQAPATFRPEDDHSLGVASD